MTEADPNFEDPARDTVLADGAIAGAFTFAGLLLSMTDDVSAAALFLAYAASLVIFVCAIAITGTCRAAAKKRVMPAITRGVISVTGVLAALVLAIQALS